MPAARPSLRFLPVRRLDLVAIGVALAFTFASRVAWAADTWTDPFPGVQRLHRVTNNQNINVLKVNLCASGISFRATKPGEKGKTTSAFAKSVGAQAAVNGDFFVGGFGLERGIAVGDGEAWPIKTPEDKSVGQLAFGDGRVELIPDSALQGVEPWMKNVVGGRPTVLLDGKGTDTSGHPDLCQRNPRTAVGLTKDKSTLFIAVVDGRAASRVGMTCTELGAFMKELGAENALAFDGGGSSTMWLNGAGVLNYPTDGSERVVANHLALYATGEGPPGSCSNPVAPGKLTSASCERGVEGWIGPADSEAVLTFDAPPGTDGALTVTVAPEGGCDGSSACERAFVGAIPEALLQDGKTHRVWGSLLGDSERTLDGSPLSFTCAVGDGGSIVDDGPAREDAGASSPDDDEPTLLGPRKGAPPGSSDGCVAAPGGASSGGALSRAALGALVAFGLLLTRRGRRP